jgi:hypothetical protein
MDPGYPDDQLTDTEWTCIWSTTPGNIGERLGDYIVTRHPIVGSVFATPADTGSDIQVGDRVETLPHTTYWTDEPVRGRVSAIRNEVYPPYFDIEFDEIQVPREGGHYTKWSLLRLHFQLLEDEN